MRILNVICLSAAEFFSATANVGAGVLRSNDNAAWACRVQSADEWNVGLADGCRNPQLRKRLGEKSRRSAAAPAARR
jgi:hypothetical protein